MKLENISDIFESGTTERKIQILRMHENSSEPKIIELIIRALDDSDIQVRGEAFSVLMLNKNKIADFLIDALKDPRKNIRGYSALILANRNEVQSTKKIMELIKDESSMVRSCALGALGHMKIKNALREIHECFSDSNLEVRKSALKAAINIGDTISDDERRILTVNKDEEIDFLLERVIKNGPGGI